MKQQLIDRTADRIATLGMAVQYGTGTDIAIFADFFDANWGIGSKKITYEALVFFDEQNQTAYMYEKTTDISRGLNFGGDTETSFQSGKTLFRKVKGVRFGPDGQSIEYDLDLGAIPKAVKETAAQFGWKFKTVLKKEKAMYPIGYIAVEAPFSHAAPSPTTPGQTPASAPSMQTGRNQTFCTGCGALILEGHAFCTKCGNPAGAPPQVSTPASGAHAGDFAAPAQAPYTQPPFVAPVQPPRRKTWWLVTLIILAVLAAAIFALAGVSLIGWVLYIVIVALNVLLYFMLRGKGAAAGIVLLILSAITLFLILGFTVGESDGKPASDSSNPAVTEPLKDVNYTSAPITMSSGGGNMTVNIATQDGEYVAVITLTVPNSILPADFMPYRSGQMYQYQGHDLQDDEWIAAFLCDQKADTFYTWSSLGPTYTGNQMDAEFTTHIYLYGRTISELKKLAEANDTIKVFRYHTMEVGVEEMETGTYEDGGTWTNTSFNNEKAYNLHPAIGSGTVPWGNIFKEAGLA